MLIIIGLALVLCLGAAAAVAIVVRAHRPTFPPVVELAQTRPLPRLGFKVAALAAREIPRTGEPDPPTPPPVPPVPFALVAQPVPATPTTPTPPVTLPAAPGADPAVEAPSVYQVAKSPYAAPIVRGARISLPDDETDLPIRFRSDHPSARAIVEAGATADRVSVTGPDGRIRIGADGPVVFGPPTD